MNSVNAAQNSPSIIEHLIPTKKDLPIYLNGSPCRACADFGSAANIIDANYAREIKIRITPDRNCDPFLLPTFGTLIWPIGRARISCAFPSEPETVKEYEFFVFEHFVYPVIMGREFLRETGTLDWFQHRLHDRPLVKHDIPIVAFLGAEEETLTIFINGEELDSAPDTGSEINVMSLEFAQTRGFTIEKDDIHEVRFADGSLQDVVGRVTVPVSFKRGPPSQILLKLVDQLSEAQHYGPDGIGKTRKSDHIYNVSIAAEFYLLDGLNADIILGEDLLASANAFVFHSQNFKTVSSPNSLYPALATIGLFKKAGKRLCAVAGRTVPDAKDLLRERDIADSKESDRYENEKERIEGLTGQEKEDATTRNERRRRDYLHKRDRHRERR